MTTEEAIADLKSINATGMECIDYAIKALEQSLDAKIVERGDQEGAKMVFVQEVRTDVKQMKVVKTLKGEKKMKIEIGFKNGSKLEITCEEFNITTDKLTGKVVSYDIKDIKDNKPLMLDFNEILYIVRKL